MCNVCGVQRHNSDCITMSKSVPSYVTVWIGESAHLHLQSTLSTSGLNWRGPGGERRGPGPVLAAGDSGCPLESGRPLVSLCCLGESRFSAELASARRFLSPSN